MILDVDGVLSLRLAEDCSGADKTMSLVCDLLRKVIDELGPGNIFSVVMDGSCKGDFPLIRVKYPHVQCFTCPAHDIDGFIKNICGSKEEFQMQRNEMEGVGVQHVVWDEDLLSCFCNGQTILSEGDGRGNQEGHLVRDGGFFEGSWGQGFHQDEGSVHHVCGCCLLEVGLCEYYLHDITLLTTLSNSTDNIVCTASF